MIAKNKKQERLIIQTRPAYYQLFVATIDTNPNSTIVS